MPSILAFAGGGGQAGSKAAAHLWGHHPVLVGPVRAPDSVYHDAAAARCM